MGPGPDAAGLNARAAKKEEKDSGGGKRYTLKRLYQNTIRRGVKTLRNRVSQNKTRLVGSGWDLDLSYITNRIIAMGFPAVGMEAAWRNPRLGKRGVVAYLDEYHGQHYKVFNICAEKRYQYGLDVFHGRAATFPFYDHNPAPLFVVAAFCIEAEMWLSRHPKNVVVVHCKAGKGRTGFIVSCLLIHLGLAKNAQQAIDYFTVKRTRAGRALNQPSQICYVNFYAKLRAAGLKLDAIRVLTNPGGVRDDDSTEKDAEDTGLSGASVRENKNSLSGASNNFHVYLPSRAATSLELTSVVIVKANPKLERIRVALHQNFLPVYSHVVPIVGGNARISCTDVQLAGDIRVTISDARKGKGPMLARYWFNTFFVKDNVWRVVKRDCDIAYTDIEEKGLLTSQSSISLCFNGRTADDDDGVLPALIAHQDQSSPLVTLDVQPDTSGASCVGADDADDLEANVNLDSDDSDVATRKATGKESRSDGKGKSAPSAKKSLFKRLIDTPSGPASRNKRATVLPPSALILPNIDIDMGDDDDDDDEDAEEDASSDAFGGDEETRLLPSGQGQKGSRKKSSKKKDDSKKKKRRLRPKKNLKRIFGGEKRGERTRASDISTSGPSSAALACVDKQALDIRLRLYKADLIKCSDDKDDVNFDDVEDQIDFERLQRSFMKEIKKIKSLRVTKCHVVERDVPAVQSTATRTRKKWWEAAQEGGEEAAEQKPSASSVPAEVGWGADTDVGDSKRTENNVVEAGAGGKLEEDVLTDPSVHTMKFDIEVSTSKRTWVVHKDLDDFRALMSQIMVNHESLTKPLLQHMQRVHAHTVGSLTPSSSSSSFSGPSSSSIHFKSTFEEFDRDHVILPELPPTLRCAESYRAKIRAQLTLLLEYLIENPVEKVREVRLFLKDAMSYYTMRERGAQADGKLCNTVVDGSNDGDGRRCGSLMFGERTSAMLALNEVEKGSMREASKSTDDGVVNPAAGVLTVPSALGTRKKKLSVSSLSAFATGKTHVGLSHLKDAFGKNGSRDQFSAILRTPRESADADMIRTSMGSVGIADRLGMPNMASDDEGDGSNDEVVDEEKEGRKSADIDLNAFRQAMNEREDDCRRSVQAMRELRDRKRRSQVAQSSIGKETTEDKSNVSEEDEKDEDDVSQMAGRSQRASRNLHTPSSSVTGEDLVSIRTVIELSDCGERSGETPLDALKRTDRETVLSGSESFSSFSLDEEDDSDASYSDSDDDSGKRRNDPLSQAAVHALVRSLKLNDVAGHFVDDSSERHVIISDDELDDEEDDEKDERGDLVSPLLSDERSSSAGGVDSAAAKRSPCVPGARGSASAKSRGYRRSVIDSGSKRSALKFASSFASISEDQVDDESDRKEQSGDDDACTGLRAAGAAGAAGSRRTGAYRTSVIVSSGSQFRSDVLDGSTQRACMSDEDPSTDDTDESESSTPRRSVAVIHDSSKLADEGACTAAQIGVGASSSAESSGEEKGRAKDESKEVVRSDQKKRSLTPAERRARRRERREREKEKAGHRAVFLTGDTPLASLAASKDVDESE